eukprot:CAMPEP_0197033088 /NCGR_PEP_ID=MMETSP1384-20130603/11593_1 /TAXON_ID=29189 /ORGANISM="Ammonia sp." /LENGTH=160 /DNA_ID=CAMNT_0042462845 /DNA_START=1 /DNA_END=483 /DNA_ORIENTATION=+
MISRHVGRAAKAIHFASCKQQSTSCLSALYIRSDCHMHTTRNRYPCTPSHHGYSANLVYTINKRWFAAEVLDDGTILDRMKKVLGEMERAKLDSSKPLTPDLHIYNDIGLDSLDFVEFGIALEDEFEIEIDDDKAENIITVGDAVKLIQECTSASSQAAA